MPWLKQYFAGLWGCGPQARLRDYWVLTKPEVNFLVLLSTLAGFYMAQSGPWDTPLLLHTLLGTLLVAGGTATLNQYLERKTDVRMHRTAGRPLPGGRVKPGEALVLGGALSLGGGLQLALLVNPLASTLALLTLGSYLAFYTPLKSRTPLCVVVGAFPGAVPPLIGWAAARGSLSGEAWALYALLLVWQFPHFLAIGWMYRHDYARAGLQMLPRQDLTGRRTAMLIMAASTALVLVSLIPTMLGLTGLIYFSGALIVGSLFWYEGWRLGRAMSTPLAKRLLHASVIYLPLVLMLLALDKK